MHESGDTLHWPDVRLIARRGIACAIAVSGLCGCGAADGSGARVTVTDSAGVRVVANDLSASTAACSLSATPATEIGVIEGAPEYQLFRVADATRLPPVASPW